MTNDSNKIPGVVIIGAGQAGCEVAFALRAAGYAGAVELIGREHWAPYRRPPLSKQFIANDAAAETLAIKPALSYEKSGINLRLGVQASAIDRDNHRVALTGGDTLEYQTLVLATGGSARQLLLRGGDLQGVHSLRTLDDAVAMRAQFKAGHRLVVVGGGFVGLEVAALAIQHGLQVCVLEAAPRLLSRVTSAPMSDFYAAAHRAAGVRLIFDASVRGFEGVDTKVSAVLCGDERIAADLVLVGVGMQAADELAAAGGLRADQGVLTDAFGRTDDPRVFAIGDCARSWRSGSELHVRIESVPNAIEQARVAAQLIVGNPEPALQAPWFWSDQYDLKLQMVGLSAGHDAAVIRGVPQSRAFMIFYLQQGRVIAADSVNRVADFNVAKKLVTDQRTVAEADLADETRPLKDLVM
ncbi:MAG: FAD-dependent oxidoreductase [Pseudomonadota bacterium]|nr:FAD-dependent oxidoreductase [Pseudomonadota bacterium]